MSEGIPREWLEELAEIAEDAAAADLEASGRVRWSVFAQKLRQAAAEKHDRPGLSPLLRGHLDPTVVNRAVLSCDLLT